MKTRLARFTVSGYRNFGDPITIDFTDVHDYKFSQECIDDGIIMKMGVMVQMVLEKAILGSRFSISSST